MGLLDTKSCGRKKALDHIDSSQRGNYVYGITPSVHLPSLRGINDDPEASCMTPRQQHHVMRILPCR
jgi:hypothetical protein